MNDDDDGYEWWRWWKWISVPVLGAAEQVFGCLVTAIWGNNHCTSTTRTLTTEQPLHTCTATITHQPRHNHNALNSTAQHLIGVVHWWVPCSVMHIYMNSKHIYSIYSIYSVMHIYIWTEAHGRCHIWAGGRKGIAQEHSRSPCQSLPSTSQLMFIWAHAQLSSFSFELLLIWALAHLGIHDEVGSWQLQNARVWKRRDRDTAKAKVDQSNADGFW